MSRMGSGGQRSERTLKLTPLRLQTGECHPEEWTLVDVHKIEKREPFKTWYADLQANILNCARKINCSLAEHPHPNANLTPDDIMQSHYVIETEAERVMSDVYARQEENAHPLLHYLSREHDIRRYKGM